MYSANDHSESWCLLRSSRRLTPNGTGGIDYTVCPLGTSGAGGAVTGLEHVVAVGELVVAVTLLLFGYRRLREATARADAAEAALLRAHGSGPDDVLVDLSI